MAELVAFRRGCDLGEGTRVDDEDTVTCEGCGARESDQSAYEGGWQLEPPVCPNCLRWVPVDETCCGESPS